jgi:DNA invertase Pin-like site-specific DNA recombinase
VGQSAATLDRPALQRLLADVAAGKVDCVVAYTFDRLTRQPSETARLLARFRRAGATLVTVCPEMFHALGGKTIDLVLLTAPRPARQKRGAAIGAAIKRRRRG